MANWKKVLVSGSTVDIAGLQINSTAVSATATELNQLDGVTVGGTSAGDIATINGTQTLTNKSIDATQLTGTINNARLDQQLQDVAGLAVTDGNIIVGDGSNFVAESGATARTSLGLGASDNVEFAEVTGSAALFSGTVTANAFSGDGSGLTGVAAGSLDIDNFTALGGATVAQGDNFLLSDGGTEKKVTFSNLEDTIFANITTAAGDVTIAAGGAATIGNQKVTNAMLADDAVGADELAANAVVNASVAANAAIVDTKLDTISTDNKVSLSALDIDGATALGAAPAGADLIPIDDGAGGTNKSMTVTNLQTFMQNNLTFTTNTDEDVSVANLKTALASNLGTATIGDSDDTIVIAGNLTVQGTKTELQTANLNVEDQFILLDSGSAGGADSGIIFGGSSDTANAGYALAWDDSAGHFGISQEIASDATGVTLDGKLGYIETSAAVPSAAPAQQGVGSIHVKTDDETIWIYS